MAAEALTDINLQGDALRGMIKVIGQNLDKAAALQISAQSSRELIAKAAQTVEEFVECWAKGTKTHMTVTKPLQFKPK